MITLVLLLLGLMFGSFVNALVWRLHVNKDWVKDRSICPHCKHVLTGKDLVPVISWLTLRGKCRYCKKPISVQYPAVELLTASLFVLSYTYWPADFKLLGILAFVSWLVCVIILVALLVYDVRWMLLPNKLVAVLTVFGSITVVAMALSANVTGTLLWAVLASAMLSGFFYALFTLSKGKWIGGGDVKIAVSLGLLAGTPSKAFLLLFLASILGTLFSLPLLLSKKLKTNAKVPFGPFLILATIIVFLFGNSIIDWYLRTFLYL